MTTQENEWREQFDKTFYEGERNSVCCKKHKAFATPIEIKTFIQNLLTTHSAHLVESAVEPVASAIYDQMSYIGIGDKPKWVDNGISLKQEAARRLARKALDQAIDIVKEKDNK